MFIHRLITIINLLLFLKEMSYKLRETTQQTINYLLEGVGAVSSKDSVPVPAGVVISLILYCSFISPPLFQIVCLTVLIFKEGSSAYYK